MNDKRTGVFKFCKKCGEDKDISEFYKQSTCVNGVDSTCKECTKDRAKVYRKENAEKVAICQAKYRDKNKDKLNSYIKEWCANNKEKIFKHKLKWIENNTIKRAAHIILNNSIANGKVLKSKYCEICGAESEVQGHHDDYNKPLDVIWMCSRCHGKEHRKIERI